MSVTDRLHAIDRRQQRTRALGFAAAVVKKFGDDQAGQLAALIAYYAFVSIFPLLLVLVTVLGFVLQGDPGEQQSIARRRARAVPRLRDTAATTAIADGSGVALAWHRRLAARRLGIIGAAQNAFNQIWHVPFKDRPDFLPRLRSLGMLPSSARSRSSRPPPPAWCGTAHIASGDRRDGVLVASRSTSRCS